VGLFISDGRLNLPLMAKDGLNRRIPPMQSRLLRKPEVLFRTGLKKSQLDIAIKDGRFPASFPILEGGRAQAWLENEIDAYIESRRQARDAAVGLSPSPKRMARRELHDVVKLLG
jgi:predicted DNA-binding transcriptional regulator AlpA